MESRYKELMAKALARIDELETQLGQARCEVRAPIAIVGLGCRFPGGGEGPQAYWEMLARGVDAVGEIPGERWDAAAFFDSARDARGKMYCRSASFLTDVYGFDPRFFGISPREAQMVDPQQRLLLEVAWEALEHAGIPAERLRGSRTGVFVGSMSYDFLQLMTDPAALDLHSGTGSALSVAAGRLSYLLDFHGPALTVDTACSSSLVAVHLACLSLRLGECDHALAGGVNAMISPLMGIAECAANMLAPDGRCKTFDAAADGYGRGEGCGLVLLKRLADAVADGNRIVAVIRGSAVNHGGQSGGLTVPNPLAQAEVMRAALANAGVAAGAVAYVEAHGTGTPLGDPIEIGSLDAVYCRGRTQDDALLVGSVKSNFGHLEGAAGIAALIKAAMAVERGEIPQHLHFHRPNPHIDWARLAIRIPAQRAVPWPGTGTRLAGVSSFGFSGTNAHLILEQAPPQPAPAQAAAGPHLLALSAKTPAALEELVGRYREFVERHPDLLPAELCFSAAAGRSHFEQRFCAMGATRAEFLDKLAAYGTDQPGSWRGNAAGRRRGMAVFVFPGSGETGPDLELYENWPVFREAFDACDRIARPRLQRPLLNVLSGAADAGDVFTAAARFAAQYALARLWMALGISPTAVVGERSGEYAAACVAGVFGPEQALALICGEPPAGTYREPELPYGSAALGTYSRHEVASGDYWRGLPARPPRLPETLRALAAAGEEIFLEMAPAGERIAADGFGALLLPRAGGERGNARLLAVLAELYVAGGDPNWRVWYGKHPPRRVDLPTYPFQRRPHRPPFDAARFLGVGREARHPLLGAPFAEGGGQRVWRASLSSADLAWLRDHRIGAQSVFPAVAYLEMASAAFRELHPAGATRLSAVAFEQPLLLDGAAPPEMETRLVEAGAGYVFSISSRVGERAWLRHAGGRIAANDAVPGEAQAPAVPEDAGIGGMDFYAAWAARGNDWRGAFRGIERLWQAGDEIVARIVVPQESGGALERYWGHPALLDACGQMLAAFADGEGCSGRFMAHSMGEVRLFAPLRGAALWSRARLRRREGRSLAGDLEIRDAAGLLLATVADCRFEFIDMAAAGETRVAARDALYGVAWRPLAELGEVRRFLSINAPADVSFRSPAALRPPLHGSPCAGGRALPGNENPASSGTFISGNRLTGQPKEWLLLADRGGFAERFAAALRERGAAATLIPCGAEFSYAGAAGRPLRVVDLRALDLATDSGDAVRECAQALAAVARSVAAVLALRPFPPTKYWLVSGGAWDGNPAQAALWGLGRTLALEQAALWGGLADIDPADTQAPQWLAAALDAEWGEDQLRVKDGQVHAARLAPLAPAVMLGEAPLLRRDGSYLISGGLGQLGLEIAAWLAARGAVRRLPEINVPDDAGFSFPGKARPPAHGEPCKGGRNAAGERKDKSAGAFTDRNRLTLVLMGRTALPARGEWDAIDPASRAGRRIAAIRAIEAGGARVETAALDVADPMALAAWLAAFRGAGNPPLRGVIHGAGHAERMPVAALDTATLAAHLAPKLGGALALDRCLAGEPLDFFVMLSSAAALLSSPELGAYAAANASLDALALARRARGQPALSVAWGPWRDAGMAAEGFSSEFKAIRALPAAEALETLGALWSAPAPYVAVLPIDWSLWARHYPSAAAAPLLVELAEANATVVGGGDAAELLALPEGERAARLLDWLARQVGGIFGSAAGEIAVDEPLSVQGMDSLMALEIRNAIERGLGLPIAIVELMGGITLRALAEHLAERLAERVAAGAPAAPALAAGNTEAAVPLTPGQHALWLIHQLAPQSSAYHVAFALRFHEAIDLDAFRDRFRTLVERHAALRSVMEPVGDKVLQRVLDEPRFGFETIDAGGWDDARLKEEVAAAYARPFDLAGGPLFRVHVFSRNATDHVMLLVAHHIVCDGWSLWILIEEFGVLCAEGGSPARQSAARLAPLPYAYADYARWQKDLATGATGERLLAYWRARLAGDLPLLDLPTDRPRPPVQTYHGATHRFLLPRELALRINALGRRFGATDFMVLLAAYNVLLHRYSGQTDLLVGCPTSGRGSGQLTGVVGHFINPVVLRSDLSGAPAFADFLAATRQTVLDALAHQDYPFALLVEKLQPERDPGRSPLFQTDFTLQRPQQSKEVIDMMIPDAGDAPALRWGDLEPAPYEIAQQEGQFDISFEAVEGGGSYFCFLKYNTDLFDAATMERMGGHFRVLLEGILAEPATRISALPLLSAAERDLLLNGFDGARRAYPSDASIAQRFEDQADKTPDKIAVVFNGARLSYRELNALANRIAALLVRCGVQCGDFVGILDARGDDFLAAMLGILKAGAAYVPIDPDYPGERIRYMVYDSRVALLVSRGAFVADAYASPALRHVLLMDGAPAPGGAPASLTFHDRAELAQECDANPPSAAGPRDRAYMIYTSGSTGAPKGAIVRHDGALNHIYAQFEALAFHAGSAFLQSAPSSSDISVWQFLAPLLIGGRTVIADFATVCSADSLYRLIGDERVTIVELVPAVLEELIAHAEADVLPALEWAMVTGEAASAALVARWFAAFPGVPLVNAYGPTEAADDVCQYVIRAPLPPATHNVPIGKTLPNLTLYVLDERLQLAPIGVPGEICVSGIGVGEGYWQKPDKTAAAFVANPYAALGKGAVLYRTGDQGRWLADGNLECLGRSDDQVKIRGFRIELGEIEAVLLRHPAVRQALAAARGEGAAKRLVAYVLAAEGASLSAAALRAHAGESLPVHMVPAAVVFLEHFPLLPNGKVNRKALPAPDDGPAPQTAGEAPRNNAQARLAALWKELLVRQQVGIHDNFFELGGHSLLMARLHRRVEAAFGVQFPLVTMFQYPTVHSLARFLRPDAGEDARPSAGEARPARQGNSDIAIVGMSCRFPGADNVEQYWRNLRDKVESVTFFTPEQLRERGVAPALLADPAYVPACAPLEGFDRFDAPFFGFNAREAEIMDPQHRLFLECAWEALEHAGYNPQGGGPVVGCFAGQGMTAYFTNNVQPNLDRLESAYLYQVEISNDKDYLATGAGYKFNLQGPCVTVQSACSTSLVAVHMACKSLLAGECDMALAGSVSANVLHQSGYLYQDGMILAPDGHCRPFDRDAKGTIPGSGLAVVVLKRLDRALADGDTVHAVIKGSALNNDGSLKAGYTAPSVEGQVGVLTRAYQAAGVDPASVTYLAAHGTATPMGDPIEIAALARVFVSGANGAGKRCAIGSVKANIGHTDTAAGIASLIAAVQAMRHREIPPQLNFNAANPAIDFAATPFYVNGKAIPWQPHGVPRRAGVSSLGIGGTNVHLVLEEAPLPAPREAQVERPLQVLLLSARSEAALDRAVANLAAHLDGEPGTEMADVAYTLAVGRKRFARRRAVVCRDRGEALAALRRNLPARLFEGSAGEEARPVAFLFTGQGSQYAGMGRELYRREAAFREVVDRCLAGFEARLGIGLREILFPAEEGSRDAPLGKRGAGEDFSSAEIPLAPPSTKGGSVGIDQTLAAQPLLFTLEYATARLLEGWGIRPDALIGHSIGEYAAACLAGVFDLDDAIFLVAQRARLMQALPAGAMAALPFGEAEAAAYLGNGLELAAANSSRLAVVSGPASAIDALEQRLAAEGKALRRLHTSHAFHSAAMEPIEAEFRAAFRNIRLGPPKIPFLSNLTATWIGAEQAIDPGYWFAHLRHTVRFAAGLDELIREPRRVLLEVGPGNVLATFALQHAARQREQVVVSCHPGARETAQEAEWLPKALARLWTAGVEIDWARYYAGAARRRVPLPTYPFERQRYWLAPRPADGQVARDEGTPARLADLGEWFARPSWQRVAVEGPAADAGSWLVFADDIGLADRVAQALRERGTAVTLVRRGPVFAGTVEEGFTLASAAAGDYPRLFDALAAAGRQTKGVLHMWSFAPADPNWAAGFDAAVDDGFTSLFHLGKELGRRYNGAKTYLKAVLADSQEVSGEEPLHPLRGCVAGLMKVIGQEYPGILAQTLDFALGGKAEAGAALAGQVLRELAVESPEPLVAWRGKFRWAQRFEYCRVAPAANPTAGLRAGGVYFITGGLGALGLTFARHFAAAAHAKLALLGRTALPERAAWDAWLADRGADDRLSRAIAAIRDIEGLGGEVLPLACDVALPTALRDAVQKTMARFGRIDGVLHLAGAANQDFPIEESTPQACAAHFAPKARGALALEQALDGVALDFCMVFSSLAALLGGLRFAPYAAANLAMDGIVLAHNRHGTPWTVVNWDGWRGAEGGDVAQPASVAAARDRTTIGAAEGIEVFHRILALPERPEQVLVSVTPLKPRVEKWIRLQAPQIADSGTPATLYQRPALATAHSAPQSEAEKEIAAIWQSLLGIGGIGVHDDFFELGGHSLLGTQLISRLRRRYQVEMNIGALFERPTVAGLAEYVESQAGGEDEEREEFVL